MLSFAGKATLLLLRENGFFIQISICLKKKAIQLKLNRFEVVEVTGFEPATFWSRTKRATKLRYTSIKNGADKGTRTLDLMITNQPLYQLSYIGIQANEACCFISIN